MKRRAVPCRPNRKVTEFFSTRPKTGPPPGQPIYYVSSSEHQSIISVSSDDVPSSSKRSQPASGASSRVHVNMPPSRVASNTRSTPYYAPSSPRASKARSTAECVPSSSPGVLRSRSRSKQVPVVPKSPSQKHANNPRKRKQPPISLITSEESDHPEFSSIYAKPSPRKNTTPASSAHAHPRPDSQSSIRGATSSSSLVPRQTDAALSTTPANVSKSQVGNPTPPRCRPSPPKRARYDSIAASDKCTLSAPDCDADDEGENGIPEPARRAGWKTTPSKERRNGAGLQVPDVHMHVDAVVTPSRPIPLKDGDGKKSGSKTKSPTQRSSWKTTPREESDVFLISQQDDEDMRIDDEGMNVDAEIAFEHISSGPQQTIPVSPSKARTHDIIARIKAKAEADATAQVQHRRRLSSLGLVHSESSSDLSSLSSDEDDLELELSAFGNSSVPAVLSRTRSPSPVDGGTRRSTRNNDAPPPNYAKKLELFRDEDDTPPPGQTSHEPSVKARGRAKTTVVCPLDVLLKDHEREDARKARVNTKRKAPVAGARDASPMRGDSAAAQNHHSGRFETPSRWRRNAVTESPGSDVSVPEDVVFGEDVLMGDAEREELLGKRSAEVVGKILQGDRDKKYKDKRADETFVFWDAKAAGGEDKVPGLLNEQRLPFLKILCDAMKRGDYAIASLLLDSGALATVPLSAQLLEWLFSTAMSTARPALSKSAYRALLVLHRTSPSKSVVTRPQLTLSTLLPALLKFGVNLQILELLAGEAGRRLPVASVGQELKVEMVCRFVALVEACGRACAVAPSAVPCTVSALLLLCLDPSTVHELQQDIVSAIEGVLAGPSITRAVELAVCKLIVHATTCLSFTPAHGAQLLAFLSGCGPSSGRVRRWTAWAMLGGSLESVEECEDVPSLEVLVSLFTQDPVGTIRLEVNRDTDYELLGARVDILSAAVTDVDAYVRQERTTRGTGGGGGGIENICRALERMNGKIVDARAAHLDRTWTKDAINRLHKRLVYQRHATIEDLRGNAGKMDRFVTKTPSKVKSKPKPVKTQIDCQ